MEYNFLKYDLNKIDHLGASYDTCSVMHYGAYAFSKVGSSGSHSLFFALSFSQFQFLSLYPIVYLAYPILFLSLYVSISLMYSSLSLFPYLSGLDKRIIYDLCGYILYNYISPYAAQGPLLSSKYSDLSA